MASAICELLHRPIRLRTWLLGLPQRLHERFTCNWTPHFSAILSILRPRTSINKPSYYTGSRPLRALARLRRPQSPDVEFVEGGVQRAPLSLLVMRLAKPGLVATPPHASTRHTTSLSIPLFEQLADDPHYIQISITFPTGRGHLATTPFFDATSPTHLFAFYHLPRHQRQHHRKELFSVDSIIACNTLSIPRRHFNRFIIAFTGLSGANDAHMIPTLHLLASLLWS